MVFLTHAKILQTWLWYVSFFYYFHSEHLRRTDLFPGTIHFLQIFHPILPVRLSSRKNNESMETWVVYGVYNNIFLFHPFFLLYLYLILTYIGMFKYNDKLHTWWFTAASKDSFKEYNLCGVVSFHHYFS